MYASFLVWLLVIPCAVSLLIAILRVGGRRTLRWVEALHLVSVSAVLALSLPVVGGVLAQGTVSALLEWLHVDALAALFLMIVAVVSFLVGIYSVAYIRQEIENGELPVEKVFGFYALFSLFVFTMLLVVTSNNIIMMWVAVEATTLGSAFLVGIHGHRPSLEAAWKYVIICTVGVAFALYGTLLVYSDAVNFLQEPGAAILWTEIIKNPAILDPTLLKLAFVFVVIGFGTKAGLFPMHAWLPDAHSEAPSPVSALLSGVLLKCALFVVIRFAILLSRGIGPQFPQTIFLVFGALSVAAASLFMFVQRDLKRLLAYSSVENIGLIVLGLGVGGLLGTWAALFHAVNHSLVKALMFCLSGNVLLKYRTRSLDNMGGLLRAAPLTSLLVVSTGLALVGAPPFNIFLSKFSIVSAGVRNGHLLLMGVCLLFLAVAFAAILRMLGRAVFGDLPVGVTKGDFTPLALVPLVVMLMLVLTLGLYLPPPLSGLLNQATAVAASGQGGLEAWIPLSGGGALSLYLHLGRFIVRP